MLLQAAKSDKDKARLAVLDASRSLEELLQAVKTASEENQKKKTTGHIQRRIASFSRCIVAYKEVLDVFVSAKPEYAALVWGTMKFLLTVCGSFISGPCAKETDLTRSRL